MTTDRLASHLTARPLFWATVFLVVWAVLSPVTAWSAAMAIHECPPVAEGEPRPCEVRREPRDLAECEAAVSAMKASGSAKQIAEDTGNRVGFLIQIICEGTPYSFTVPGG